MAQQQSLELSAAHHDTLCSACTALRRLTAVRATRVLTPDADVTTLNVRRAAHVAG